MYNNNIDNDRIHFVEEPQIDLFSYTKENKLNDEFSIISKTNNVKFETIGNDTLLANGNCVNYLKFLKASTVAKLNFLASSYNAVISSLGIFTDSSIDLRV